MSTNLTKQKRDGLLSMLTAIRSYIAAAPQDENTANLLAYLSELEKDVGGKRYGLVFEEHRESVDELLEDHVPVLTEDRELFIDNGGEMNFLLEGDNLAALELLKKTHEGRIDLIYIDPPYNTGNRDFVYDDCFVDAQDTFRHSKWLSFMSRRLEAAKRLLSDRGVIFISIDDNESFGLKLLCDEIFNESCFVAKVTWQNNYSLRNDAKGIPYETDNILVYSKKLNWTPKRLPRTEEMNARYVNYDNDTTPYKVTPIHAPGASTHKGMVYGIQHPITGEIMYPPKNRHWKDGQEKLLKALNEWSHYELRIIDDADKRSLICGGEVQDIPAIMLSIPLSESAHMAKKRYETMPWPEYFFLAKGLGSIQAKTYLDETKGKVVSTLWRYEDVGTNVEATNELKPLLNDGVTFSTPKPVRLIDRIITIASQPDSTILDFFAGSGTTGHAVLAHNAAHPDSRRKFILCTNNENNICRNVTYERLRRVIASEGYAASLKYDRVDYVPIGEQLYYDYADQLLRHVRELVELENGVNFIENAEIAIVLTDGELADFIARPEAFDKCRTMYLGHDILCTREQAELLKARNVKVNIIPAYYYRELEG